MFVAEIKFENNCNRVFWETTFNEKSTTQVFWNKKLPESFIALKLEKESDIQIWDNKYRKRKLRRTSDLWEFFCF